MNLGGCGRTPKDSGTETAKERREEANLNHNGGEDPDTTGAASAQEVPPGLVGEKTKTIVINSS